MTDVFISYKREERAAAERIAKALAARGLNVWWDADMLPGEAFRKRTIEVLRTCKAAVVVWSRQSAQSNWVLDEATRANDRGVLVPVLIEPIDDFPLGFGQLHAHTLIDWQGEPNDPIFEPVVAAVNRLLSPAASPVVARDVEPSQAELLLWRGIQESNRREDFQSYLERYPTGVFAPLARQRLDGLAPKPSVRAISSANAATRPGLTKWDFAFLGLAAFVTPFVIWPIVNAMIGAIGDNGVFFAADYAGLFNLGNFTNLFFMIPTLLAACWAIDTFEGWLDVFARSKGFNRSRFALHAVIGAALLAALFLGLNYGIDDGGVRAHMALWSLVVWLALLVTRRASARLRRLA